MLRDKDKIEKYLDRVIKKCNGTVTRSGKSSYYFINSRVIRVSDHIGKNSTGNISIIFDTTNSGKYILHGHSSGNIAVVTYDQLKELVRSFKLASFLYSEIGHPVNILDINKDVATVENEEFMKTILTFIKTTFTPKQIRQMRGWNPKIFKYE